MFYAVSYFSPIVVVYSMKGFIHIILLLRREVKGLFYCDVRNMTNDKNQLPVWWTKSLSFLSLLLIHFANRNTPPDYPLKMLLLERNSLATRCLLENWALSFFGQNEITSFYCTHIIISYYTTKYFLLYI